MNRTALKPNTERLTATFLDLVRIPSPSWKEEKVIRYITGRLKKLRVPFELLPCGPSHNLLARVEGTRRAPTTLLSCHMDTVVPCDRVTPVVKGNRVSSDGTSILGGDDKAAVAAILETLAVLKEEKMEHGPLEILFSCAEEVGLKGIKAFDFSLLKARYGFVFDSGGKIGTVILKAPSQISMEITVRGKAAHAGMEPEKGISAIRVLADIISSIPHGRLDPSTTVNVGTIGGGKATNIVAEEASCLLEARSLQWDRLRETEETIRKICKMKADKNGARVKIKRTLEYRGFSIDPAGPVARIADRAIKALGRKPLYTASGGGSDTNVINQSGIRAINLSIGMRNVHTTRENILLSDLAAGAGLMLSIIDSVR